MSFCIPNYSTHHCGFKMPKSIMLKLKLKYFGTSELLVFNHLSSNMRNGGFSSIKLGFYSKIENSGQIWVFIAKTKVWVWNMIFKLNLCFQKSRVSGNENWKVGGLTSGLKVRMGPKMTNGPKPTWNDLSSPKPLSHSPKFLNSSKPY